MLPEGGHGWVLMRAGRPKMLKALLCWSALGVAYALLGGCSGVTTEAARCATEDPPPFGCPGASDRSEILSRISCTEPCTGDLPFCDYNNGRCVACVADKHCIGNPDGPICDREQGRCIAECATDDECTDYQKPVCDTEFKKCGGCTVDEQCDHIADHPFCEAGQCIQCRLDAGSNEEGVCDDPGVNQGCDLATGLCSGIPRDSVDTCGACLADSECKNADHYCVPMFFKGEALEGGFCLKTDDSGCNNRPYTVPTEERTSLSGLSDIFCGVDESVTTCVAVQQLIDNDFSSVQCNNGNMVEKCGVPGLPDSICATVNANPGQCTYSCSGAADCPSSRPCNNGYCGG